MRTRTRVSLPGRMRQQTQAAVRGADVALFVIDAREGVTPLDAEIGRWLRAEDTPIVLVGNKAESNAARSGLLDAYSLGLGEPIPLSAEHGEGVVDLFEALRPFVEAGEGRRAGGGRTRTRAGRSSWRSSGGPTPASRRWSTGCSGRTG